MKKANFIVVLLLLISVSSANAQSKVESGEVNSMIKNDKKWVVLDVRTPGEYNLGHIKGAINIDISQADALSKIDKLDHNGKYIVLCRTNNRSKHALDYMKSKGFKTIYQMTDGMVGWKGNGLPVVK